MVNVHGFVHSLVHTYIIGWRRFIIFYFYEKDKTFKKNKKKYFGTFSEDILVHLLNLSEAFTFTWGKKKLFRNIYREPFNHLNVKYIWGDGTFPYGIGYMVGDYGVSPDNIGDGDGVGDGGWFRSSYYGGNSWTSGNWTPCNHGAKRFVKKQKYS